MHAKSAHRSRHAHHHHHHKQPSLPNETENNTITSTTTATTTDGNMATTKEIDDNNTSNTIVGESAKCMHHRSSVSHAHHHQHHIKQHSTTALGHNHAPHHHHHHHHNHHGRHHHHHQNHKKRLVLDTRDNESNEQQQNPDTDASNVNVVDVQQQQDEGDTQFSVNQLRNSIKDGPTTEVLGDEVDGDTDRQPMQELNSNVHTHCCPYHERHAACQHHVGQSTGHEHSKHHHHPHHHHHHHHHHGHQDQKKSASTTDQHQQLSLNKGLNHKHHHHHHHHHGHHHGTSGGGTKQRYGRNKVKNSSNSNLNEQDHSTVISAHQHHHHHHHPHHHHHHHRHQQQAQEIGVVGQEELLTNKGASFDAQHSMQKQDLEPITNGDEDAHNSTNNITSNCDHPFGNKLTKKGREENADDDDEVESKMNLDQDDRDDGGVNEEGRMQDLQQTIVTTNTTKNANNINAETNKNGSSDEVVRMDMTLNNEGCTRLISDNEASTSKKITESQTNEFQNLINSIDVEVSQPILQQVSSLANKSNLKSATNTKTNDANEMLMINGNHQKPTQIIQQAKDSDASAINGGESTSNKNRQTSHNEFSQNQEGDSKRGKNAEQQDRRVVRQTSSSRENSQKDTGGAKRQEQQLAECSPIHSESYQQQSQQTDQPKQIIEYTVPPDRRCRLCWCCCCPCSGLVFFFTYFE